MSAATPPERFTLIDAAAENQVASFAAEVRAGLAASPKRLPCRFFYDREGSLLFEAICELPEYYLTRAEEEILREHVAELAAQFPEGVALLELGSGSAAKTRILLEEFLRRQKTLRYVPVDIARSILEESSRALLRDYPGLEIRAIVGEYEAALSHLNADAGRRKLILWLGSNIGNMDREEAAHFLRRLREQMTGEDRLLVAVDLRKDRRVLEAAYDDAQGVTARFNRNILARINRELGGCFDLSRFEHRAVYDEEAGRVEMYLVSTAAQRVRIAALNWEAGFAAGEAIHTENSYKYSRAEIGEVAAAAGLGVERQWLDRESRYSLNLLAPKIKADSSLRSE